MFSSQRPDSAKDKAFYSESGVSCRRSCNAAFSRHAVAARRFSLARTEGPAWKSVKVAVAARRKPNFIKHSCIFLRITIKLSADQYNLVIIYFVIV